MPEAKTAHSELPGNVTRLLAPSERAPSEPWRLPPPTSPGPDPDKEARRAEKRLRELSEPVEPWERYRALRQTLDEAQKFEDLADHKARFAMILMGALNALLLVMALSEPSGGASLASQPWIVGYLLLCGVNAIYLFHQAIEALRPRSWNRRPSIRDAGAEPAEAGLRHHDEVLRQSQEAYLSAWQRVGVEQLNREIARQVHQQAQVNQVKERALTRLYAGLRVMMFLLVGLVLILVTGPRSTTPPPTHPGGAGTSDHRMEGREPGRGARLGPGLLGSRLRDLRSTAGS